MNALEYIGEGDGKLYYSLWGWEDDRPTSELWLIQSNIESCKVLTAKVPRDIVAQMVIDIQVSVDGDISLMTATGEGLNFYTWQADVDF